MRKTCCFLLSFLMVYQITAQKTNRVDTIDLARTKAYQKDFSAADHLLTKYNTDHISLDGMRLHAQVLYWMKAFDRSLNLYQRATSLFPQNRDLQLDYARVLFDLNKLSKAEKLLDIYVSQGAGNVEANILLAYIDLWKGKISQAKERAMALNKKYPGNEQAADILYQVKYFTAPYVKATLGFISDDQPLKGTNYHIEGGVYRSWLLFPVVQASVYRHKINDTSMNSSWLRVGNTIQPAIGSSLMFGAGVYTNGEQSDFTGNIAFSQKFLKNFLVRAGFERRPYQYSVASIRKSVLENNTAVSVSYNKDNMWFGKAGYELHSYKDDNNVKMAYLWASAPLIFKPRFALNAGYAFSHGNSDGNTFVSRKTLAQDISSTPVSGQVKGIYDPYFTPRKQNIHSAIASVRVNPVDKIEFNSRVSISVSAKTENPVLTLERAGTQYYIAKSYHPHSYTSFISVSELTMPLSTHFHLSLNYTHEQLLFYTSNTGNVQLKYVFFK